MIMTVGKCDLKEFGEMRPVPTKTQSFAWCEKDEVCLAWHPIETDVLLFLALQLRAHIFMYVYAQTPFCVQTHTRTHVYSTHNPQRFRVIDSVEHQIAHCDK